MNQRLSEHFSSREATDELEAAGAALLETADAWLKVHEPAFYAMRGPRQQVDSAMQAILAAEATRSGGDGRAGVAALAHAVGLVLVQQADIKLAWQSFSKAVEAHVIELRQDTAAAKAASAGAA